MFSLLRALFHRGPQKLFTQPIQCVPTAKPPAWLGTLSPVRTFATPAEAHCAYREIEARYAIARERSGATQQAEEAEMRAAIGFSLTNERP